MTSRGLFWRQFKVLFWKNWVVLAKHPFLNIIRCFILPIAYGVFLAVAQLFLAKPNNYGIGSQTAVDALSDVFDGTFALIWADGTNASTSPTPDEVIQRITQDFTATQRAAVRKVSSPSDIPGECPQNFNLFSECFGAVAFYDIPSVEDQEMGRMINYTIRADGGLFHIDVVRHRSDFELRLLPLQWAIDKAIIELQTGQTLPTPQEWPFTQETNEEQFTQIRLSYIRGLRTLLVIALFICFVGIAYQLPGAVTAERANQLTPHMKVMGLLDSARITSWHLSLTLAYIPAWTIVALVWHYRIFTATNAGLVWVVHILFGLVLASWSFFVAASFGKSPQLAAVASTFLSIVFGILALVFNGAGDGAAFVFSLLFPPGYYIFAIRAICGWENHQLGANVLQGDPDSGLRLLPLLIVAVIDVFLWPLLGILWERRLYDARNPKSPQKKWWPRGKSVSSGGHVETQASGPLPDNIAISVRNLNKTFTTSFFRPKTNKVVAVEDLSFDVPKHGIFVLLGSNGAGKSTTLSILGGLSGRTSGSVQFSNGASNLGSGELGIVPQKNVLFPELTCYQTLQVWKAIKWNDKSEVEEDLEQLLRDCDLGKKIYANADTLSGGQKRKLQLAIGLVGGSSVVLVDECTSGVDPLSRRSLWRTLTALRNERTIVFTTHFLDEADLLADHIAILAAPGKLVAEGTPVSLKRELGEGYTVQVAFNPPGDEEKGIDDPANMLLQHIRQVASEAYLTTDIPLFDSYHLKTKDASVVGRVLQNIDQKKAEYNIKAYDVIGTTIEDIFLSLMSKDDQTLDSEKSLSGESTGSLPIPPTGPDTKASTTELSSGRRTSPLHQALTVFYKRCLIIRRSWLSLFLAAVVAVCGSTIPLVFIQGREQTCVRKLESNGTVIPLYLPILPIAGIFTGDSPTVLVSPPELASVLGNNSGRLDILGIQDNNTFVDTISKDYRNLSLGGVSVSPTGYDTLFAWEATPPGYTGLAMLNLASNALYNRALNVSSGGGTNSERLIQATFESFPPVAAGTLVALKWVAFFGATMAVYPAFFALYVSKERRSSVQAMQFSNGLSNPLGLWIGHLAFDTMFSVLAATVITIVFATATSTGQFHGLGLFWVVLVLYGITGTLFAYCGSLVVATPLAAFAAVAGYQVIMFVLYLAGYLLTLTYAKTSEAGDIITIIHFTLSILSPVASVMRAALVSVNLFSLLCSGTEAVTTSQMGTIMRFGGPILYLIVYAFVLLAVLVWVDSGTKWREKLTTLKYKARSSASQGLSQEEALKEDVMEEVKAISDHDILRVLNVSKRYGGSRVVDDVSFGVAKDTIFALLGPNGAGKTTTFNLIRGDVVPEDGEVFIDGTSVISNPRTARFLLGVCPQFTAIDSQLTVREHLIIYGRLKGLRKGRELDSNVDILLNRTRLDLYADRLASRLSGGNQRKLSLAISLIGNPPVILIDEFSTGIDAKMKREMWLTLRNVAAGKAVIITTHSMEEASALATKVGIIAKRMLAVGTLDSLSDRYGNYEVHFSCRTREDVQLAQSLMAHIPNARMADDVATRFEVPISQDQRQSLAELFTALAGHAEGLAEFTVEKATLESVFLKVIRENNVREENEGGPEGHRHRRWWRRDRA